MSKKRKKLSFLVFLLLCVVLSIFIMTGSAVKTSADGTFCGSGFCLCICDPNCKCVSGEGSCTCKCGPWQFSCYPE